MMIFRLFESGFLWFLGIVVFVLMPAMATAQYSLDAPGTAACHEAKAGLSDPGQAASFMKSAATEDFMSFSEQQTGQDLHTFFDVWLYGTGFPEFNLRSEEGVQTRSISLIK